jgi:hypothetical protein
MVRFLAHDKDAEGKARSGAVPGSGCSGLLSKRSAQTVDSASRCTTAPRWICRAWAGSHNPSHNQSINTCGG